MTHWTLTAYRLDILVTNLEYKHQLCPVAGLTCVKWYGLLPHNCIPYCCRIQQRPSCSTQPSRSPREVFDKVQRSRWSHCVAHFLPKTRVRSVGHGPAPSASGIQGVLTKDDGLHDIRCPGIPIGRPNTARIGLCDILASVSLRNRRIRHASMTAQRDGNSLPNNWVIGRG